MNVKILTTPWLPNQKQQKLGTHRWGSLSGCSREPVADILNCKCWQDLNNRCLQQTGTYITNDRKVKISDSRQTLIFKMRQWVWRSCFCQERRPIYDKWMAATNWNINDPRYRAKNCWCSISAHSQNGSVTQLLSLLAMPAAHISVIHLSDQISA